MKPLQQRRIETALVDAAKRELKEAPAVTLLRAVLLAFGPASVALFDVDGVRWHRLNVLMRKLECVPIHAGYVSAAKVTDDGRVRSPPAVEDADEAREYIAGITRGEASREMGNRGKGRGLRQTVGWHHSAGPEDLFMLAWHAGTFNKGGGQVVASVALLPKPTQTLAAATVKKLASVVVLPPPRRLMLKEEKVRGFANRIRIRK